MGKLEREREYVYSKCFRRAGGLRPYERIPCPALMQQVSMVLVGVAWGLAR